MEDETLYYVYLVLVMLFWGIAWPVSHKLVELAPPMTVGFLRFSIAFIVFIPLVLISNHNQLDDGRNQTSLLKRICDKTSLIWFAILGVTGIFGYGIFFLLGMQLTTAAQGSIIAGINPAVISLIAHINGERLDERWQYWGFFISFAGVVFVIGMQSILDFNLTYLIGDLLIVAAMVCWGVYSSIGKTVVHRYSSLETTAGAIFFGVIPFAIGAVYEQFWTLEILKDPFFWFSILVLALLSTVFGYFVYFFAISKVGATKASIFINLVPIFGVISSALLIQEIIYWTFIVGLVLIILGIFFINNPQFLKRSVHKLNFFSK